jgi:DNA replication and repair protein RecF
VVLFTPDDVGLIKGAPERRRRFIDRGIFTGRPAHLDDFLTYRRALDARNKLLRDKAGDDLLDVYEHTLAQVGAQLVAARKKFIDDLKPLFKSNVETILTSQSGVELRYRQSIPESNSMAEDMIKTWGQDRIKDRERGFTQKGPHADDLVITLHGHSARSYASQGQQRSLVLALKLAEIQLLEDKNNSVPIVLLDDVSSELDAERNARLFEFLNGFAGQVFITTTDPAYLQIKDERQNFVIDKGVLASQEI